MNLTQLRYFCAVYTSRSVSAAAEYLHISQPSLSAAIRELENEFGVMLFRRHHRGMTPTEAGETLYRLSRDLLGRSDEVETLMRELGSERTRLRLGVPPMIGSHLFPHLYSDFLPAHPEIQLEITESGRHELYKKLVDDSLDMYFFSHRHPPDSILAFRPVTQMELVCCVSRTSPLASRSSITPQDLADVPLVLFKDIYFLAEEIRRLFALAGVQPSILLQSEQVSTIQSLVAGDAAVGFLFRGLAEKNPALVCLPIGDGLYVDVSLAWKKDARLFGAMRTFRDYNWSKYF